MKKLLTRTTAAFSAVVISVCGCFGNFNGSAAETEDNEVTVSFDFGTDISNIEQWYATDGNLTDFERFEPFKAKKRRCSWYPVRRACNTKSRR